MSHFSFTGWLTAALARSRRLPRQARPQKALGRPRFAPRLEVLEDRTVPSTFTVTSLADSGPGTLRAGVATPGVNAIHFASGLHGTITLASEINITSSLTIQGPGANQLTVSGGSGATRVRVFDVSGSSTQLTMNGLTIANGLAPVSTTGVTAGAAFGGGLLNEGATVSIDQVVFANNQAGNGTSYAGGGAVANLGGRFTDDHTSFLNNTAYGASTDFSAGGAVYDDMQAIVSIAHGTFAGNLVTAGNSNGGAIGHFGGSQLTLSNSTFIDNHSLGVFPGSPNPSAGEGSFGGAIYSDQNITGFFSAYFGFQPTMNIANCSFTGNVSQSATSPAGQEGGSATGGALDVESLAEATVSNCTFDSNLALAGNGGAGTAGMDGGDGNVAKGGAIFNNTAFVTVSNSQFIGNQAIGSNGGAGGANANGGDAGYSNGGAIDATTGQDDPTESVTTISNCLFQSNLSLGGSGGAGGVGGNGGAGARGDGGAFAAFICTLNVSNCAIVNNTSQGGAGGAPGHGGVGGDGGLGRAGGFANERGAVGTVINTTIVNNLAIGGVGGAGGSGGNAIGGGVYNGREAGAASSGNYPYQEANLELINCTVVANRAQGGAGGVGGNGGFASGGGVYNGTTDADGNPIAGTSGSPTLDLDGTNVTGDQAVGGAARAGGVAGAGVGGGLYNDSPNGAVAQVDSHSKILGNRATTSNDNIFGIITPI